MGARAVIALGGNAMAPAGTAGTAEQQTAKFGHTMRAVAELIAADGLAVVLTHGNGPQVGNPLIKNEMAREVVVPMPGVALDHGGPDERWLERVSVGQLRAWHEAGEFHAGSMCPEVVPACRFAGGRTRLGAARRAVIAGLDDCVGAVRGRAGTQILADEP